MDEIANAIEPILPSLRRYARALLRDREAADDLVQDCLERAIGRWALRRRDGDLKAWLFAILHNRFLDVLRQRRREGRTVELDEAGDMPAPGGLAGTGSAEGRLHLGDALTALDRLPAEQRAVLLLIGVEDLSYEAAARVLCVPVGTVMSRLSRARERLRSELESAPAPSLRRVK